MTSVIVVTEKTYVVKLSQREVGALVKLLLTINKNTEDVSILGELLTAILEGE